MFRWRRSPGGCRRPSRRPGRISDSAQPNRRPTREVLKGERPVFLTEEGRFIDCPVFDRYGLEPGATVNGPAIVEEREATVFVGPDARCAIDEHLNLVMSLG